MIHDARNMQNEIKLTLCMENFCRSRGQIEPSSLLKNIDYYEGKPSASFYIGIVLLLPMNSRDAVLAKAVTAVY